MTIHAFKESGTVQNATPDTTTTGGWTDARLSEWNPTVSYGTAADTEVADQATGYRDASVFYVDLSALPSSKTISAATLYLYMVSAGSNTHTNSIYRLRRAYAESEVTWNVYSAGNNWDTSGALNTSSDYDSSALDAVSVGTSTPAWVAFDVTTAVQNFYSATWTNYGFIIRRTDGAQQFEAKRYNTSENSTENNRPELVVVYETAASFKGIEVIRTLVGVTH